MLGGCAQSEQGCSVPLTLCASLPFGCHNSSTFLSSVIQSSELLNLKGFVRTLKLVAKLNSRKGRLASEVGQSWETEPLNVGGCSNPR